MSSSKQVVIDISSDSSSDSEFDFVVTRRTVQPVAIDSFVITLTKKKIESNKLTIPSKFVKDNNLLDFDVCYVIFTEDDPYGTWFDLTNYLDKRTPGPTNHMVINGDWKAFMRKHGIDYGYVCQFTKSIKPLPNSDQLIFNVQILPQA